MPHTGHRGGGAHHGCACQNFNEVDAHLISEAEGSDGGRLGASSSSSRAAPNVFCPGATQSHYAPDLLLEPIHLNVTLHVDLDQQCMVVDEVITVRCNVPNKSCSYTLSLDGMGFQHLHASRLASSSPISSQPNSPRNQTPPKAPEPTSQPESHSGSARLFGLLRPFERKSHSTSSKSGSSSVPARQSQDFSMSESASSSSLPAEIKDATSFYCTYDGRRITLSWIGQEAFNGGTPGAIEQVRLIYLVDKPITGLHFTKPPTEVELEAIDQQQKPLVSTTFAVPKSGSSSGSASTGSISGKDSLKKSIPVVPPKPAGVSPFHSSRPLLAATDHETERARYWLATIDSPNVRPTTKYVFVVKAGLAAIANGELLHGISTDVIPPWPLSLFNPPISHPKPPTYPRTVFVWSNPYPTPAYLVAFAVGQLHYLEAIPPRPANSAQLVKPSTSTTPAITTTPASGASTPVTSTVSSSSNSTSSHNHSHGHKRTQSEDLKKVKGAPESATAEVSRTVSLRLHGASITDSREFLIGMSQLDTSNLLAPYFKELDKDEIFQHHRKSSRKREEASWIIRDIPMRFYTPRNVPLSTVQLMLAKTPDIMKWLQARLGLPFPYPIKYYQFVAPELPSAMENITLTTWGNDYLLNPVWALEYGASTESINVHEMAHSYFGNSVGIKFWEHAWLKEGWANYVECLWQEDKYGADALAYMIHRNGKLYMKESDNLYCRSIVTSRYDSSWDLYDQHLYRGGSRRLHTLRCMIGEDIFWPAITDYLRTYHNKLVETDDFRKVLEKHSHRNLVPFFNEWLYSPGYPKITATYEYSPNRQQVNIHAQQTQMDEKRGIKTFSMAIPVDIAYMVPTAPHPVASVPGNLVTGSTSTSTSTTTSKVKWMKTELVFAEGATEAHLTISVPSPPLQVIFDKKQMYTFTLSMDPGFTVLRTMALHCWSVPHRIWAAAALLERGSPQELEVISEMLLHREQHWGVIADVAVALAKQHRSHKATTILCKLLHSPSGHPSHQPRALMSIALALGQITDPRISTAIRQFLASRRYTTLHKVDEGALRAINSHSSLSSLAEAAESFQRKSGQPLLSANIESDDEDDSDPETSDESNPDIKLSPEAEGDNTIPYKTHARLLAALAAQGEAADETLIIEQSERTRYGWLGIVRGSALSALAEYGSPSAFEYILEATRITQHQHLKARAAAISALAQCVYKSKMSPPLLQRAVHTLHLLLHDATYLIRFTTVHALFKLLPAMSPAAAQESLNAIHHIRKSLSNQDRMWVKRKRLLVKGGIKAKTEQGLLTSSGPGSAAKISSSSSSTPHAHTSVSSHVVVGPSMDEFLALKQEILALKARVTSIEEQLEADEDDDEDDQ